MRSKPAHRFSPMFDGLSLNRSPLSLALTGNPKKAKLDSKSPNLFCQPRALSAVDTSSKH
jgi:hypothetical protein